MMDRTFIEAITKNAQPEAITVDGRSFSTAPLHNLPLPTEPDYPSISLLALDSLSEFVKSEAADLKVSAAFIRCNSDIAQLVSKPMGENRKRDHYVHVKANVDAYGFGNFQSLEDFRLSLLTKFIATEERASLLQFIAKITDSNVKTSEDDGVSQTVTAKVGIASYGAATVPSVVHLRPIRTFQEVEQPEGMFQLRLRSVKDALPQAALFEIHTNWQRAAALSVKAYLDAKGLEIPIYA